MRSITLLLITTVCGCVSYKPKPLDAPAISHALTPPNAEGIRVEAAQLRHPLLSPLTVDLRKGLSPEEAGIVAVVVNPELRSVRDQRAGAAAQLLQAGLLPNPQLTAGVDVPYKHGPGDGFTAYNVGLSWDFTSLISLDEKKRAASTNAAGIELDIAWKEWQTAEAAKLAAYAVLALQDTVRAATDAKDYLEHNLSVLRQAVEGHDKTLLDLSAAETAAQDAQSVVLAQKKDLRHEMIQLRRAVGVPPESEMSLRAERLPSYLEPPAYQELVGNLETRRLDLLALKMGYESQEATLHAAVLGQFPRINLGFNTARDTANVRTIGFGVAIDIPIFDRGQGVIATEAANRQKLFDEFMSRIFGARYDIATAIGDIRAVNVQIAALEAAIPGLERLIETYRTALAQGNADVLTFYTAQGTLAQKRIEVIKLKQQLVENWIALEIASGRYLPITPLTTRPSTRPATQEIER